MILFYHVTAAATLLNTVVKNDIHLRINFEKRSVLNIKFALQIDDSWIERRRAAPTVAAEVTTTKKTETNAMKEAAVAKNDNIPESLMEPLKHLVQSNLVSLKAKLKSNPQQIQTYLQQNLKAFNALNPFQQTVIVLSLINI